MVLKSIVAVGRNRELQDLAARYAQKVIAADDPKDAFELMSRSCHDLAIFDDIFSHFEIDHFIKRNNDRDINIPVVITSTQGKKADSEKLLQAGAVGYICLKKEISLLEKLIKELSSRSTKKNHEEIDRCFINETAATVGLAGQSPAMFDTMKMIELVASSNCNPILVFGETGTGKELAAKAVHQFRNPKKIFVAVNCAALTANLLESELFGHVKGSFTGADSEKTGLLELAKDGTLFLDEISEMPMDLQAKLLRVLQEKTFRKVGGTKFITCNATIVASSNRNLLEEAKKNRFRQDLYYRLNICPIKLSPLRFAQRKADIELLANFFLKTSNIWPEKSQKIKSITPLAIETLQKHNWPGNVRELKNVIDRAILLETTDKIGISSIAIDDNEQNTPFFETSDSMQTRINDFSLATAERELIARALRETDWQKTKAAALLGITRATLYAKVKQYDIKESIKESKAAGNEQHQQEKAFCTA